MVTVACLQLNSGSSVVANLQTVLRLAARAIEKDNAQWIVLPENAFCHPYDKHRQAELDQVLPVLQNFAQQKQVWIFAGTIPLPANDGSGKVYSALQVINDRGEIAALYRKLHLFDVHVADEGVDYRESDTFEAGDNVVVVPTPWGKVGLAICYDLRFPELFLAMAAEQPFAFVVPCAFTLHTGRRHWHTLLKARAIDTFTWVLAAGQTGTHSNGRQTFGHSAIVTPDGAIVAELAEGEGYVCHVITAVIAENLRKNIPLQQHRVLKPD
jgi:predicted amidohydrolase